MSRWATDASLHSHVVIDGHTKLGKENEIFPFASIGLKTQDLKWKGGVTRTEIGDGNTFREYVTIHSATGDGEVTRVGSHNHILAYCHIAHNCMLGNHIIMSNVATLAGHVTVEDHAVIGGLAAVHQFCRIGKMCDDRRLLESGAGRAAVHDGRRQSRRDAHHQQNRHGTQRRFRGGAGRAASRLTKFYSAKG